MALNQWRLGLADFVVDVEIRGPLRAEHVARRFGAYVTDRAGEPDARLVVTGEREAATTLVQPSGTAWPACEGVVLDDGRRRFRRSELEMVVSRDGREATATVVPIDRTVDLDADSPESDTPLRILLTLLLRARDGLMLHACGHANTHAASVFFGVADAGKTTTARKLPPDEVLSDDQVALRRLATGWTAYALPFVGELGRVRPPRRASLGALFELAQRPDGLVLARLSPPRALAALARCTVCHTASDPDGPRAFAALLDLAATIPTHRLALGRTTPIDGVLAGAGT